MHSLLNTTTISKKIEQNQVKIKGKKPEKIPLSEKVYEALEEKAKAEGKTPDELATEIVTSEANADVTPLPAEQFEKTVKKPKKKTKRAPASENVGDV